MKERALNPQDSVACVCVAFAFICMATRVSAPGHARLTSTTGATLGCTITYGSTVLFL